MILQDNNQNVMNDSDDGSTNSGPTVLVKKADGTTERVPLSQLRKKKTFDPIGEKKQEDSKLITPAVKKEKIVVEPMFTAEMYNNASVQDTISEVSNLDLSEKKNEVKVEPSVSVEVPDSDVAREKNQNIINSFNKTFVANGLAVDDGVVKTDLKSEEEKFSSPLEEESSQDGSVLGRDDIYKRNIFSRPVSEEEFANKALEKTGLKLPAYLLPRFYSLVFSWRKGIRDDFKFLSYARAGRDDNGLGFTAGEAEMLLKAIKKEKIVFPDKVKPSEEVLPVAVKKVSKEKKNKDVNNEVIEKKKEGVVKIDKKKNESTSMPPKEIKNSQLSQLPNTPHDLTTTTPVVDIFKDEAAATIVAEKDVEKDIEKDVFKDVNKAVVKDLNIPQQPPVAKFTPLPSSKDSIRDIKPPEPNKFTVGPEDEISNFTLIDFRRLDNNPEKAADRLLAKFEAWKEDSYLTYIGTVEAWKKSPVFRQYLKIVERSLEDDVPMIQIFSSLQPDEMNESEFFALTRVNKNLSN